MRQYHIDPMDNHLSIFILLFQEKLNLISVQYQV